MDKPIIQVMWLQQMEDMEDSEWQTRDGVTNKRYHQHRLLISAQRSLPDMAAVRVGQPPKLELAGR